MGRCGEHIEYNGLGLATIGYENRLLWRNCLAMILLKQLQVFCAIVLQQFAECVFLPNDNEAMASSAAHVLEWHPVWIEKGSAPMLCEKRLREVW